MNRKENKNDKKMYLANYFNRNGLISMRLLRPIIPSKGARKNEY